MIRLKSRWVIPKIFFCRVPKGPAGTLATASIIARMILSGAKDFYVRQKAIQIFRRYRIPPKDRPGEIAALFDWVRRNVRYTRDIYRVELLHTARRMLELRAGDCDDMTIVLGAMLLATGHPVRLALVGFRPHKPHAFSHIYLEVRLNGRWVPLDPTVDQPMGWAPPALWKRIYEIRKEEVQCLSRTV
jgi:hypothetical protein